CRLRMADPACRRATRRMRSPTTARSFSSPTAQACSPSTRRQPTARQRAGVRPRRRMRLHRLRLFGSVSHPGAFIWRVRVLAPGTRKCPSIWDDLDRLLGLQHTTEGWAAPRRETPRPEPKIIIDLLGLLADPPR